MQGIDDMVVNAGSFERSMNVNERYVAQVFIAIPVLTDIENLPDTFNLVSTNIRASSPFALHFQLQFQILFNPRSTRDGCRTLYVALPHFKSDTCPSMLLPSVNDHLLIAYSAEMV
jgi:hypothetical protein